MGLVSWSQSQPAPQKLLGFCSCPSQPGSPPSSTQSVFSQVNRRIVALCASKPSLGLLVILCPLLSDPDRSLCIFHLLKQPHPQLLPCAVPLPQPEMLFPVFSSRLGPVVVESPASMSCREAFLKHPAWSRPPRHLPAPAHLLGSRCVFAWVLDSASLVRLNSLFWRHPGIWLAPPPC